MVPEAEENIRPAVLRLVESKLWIMIMNCGETMLVNLSSENFQFKLQLKLLNMIYLGLRQTDNTN